MAIASESRGRNRLYAATERLYSIYYKLRRERNEAAVVEVLIEFMVTFYDVGEVYRLTESLIDEAISSTDINAGISRALASRPQSQDSALSVKWRMVETTLDKVRDRQNVDAIESFQNNIQAAFHKEDWHRALEIVENYEKESLPFIESGLEGEPNWAYLAHIRSDAYLCLKEYRKVIEIGEEVVVKLNGTRDASMRHRACSIALNKAAAYYELGDFENSKLDCVRLDKRFGQHGSPWYDLQISSALVLHAESEIEIGNLKPATEILNEVVNRFANSESVDVRRVVAKSMVTNANLVAFRLDDLRRASEIYGELVERFRESEDDEILRCVESSWLNQGFVFGGSGHFEQEIECYEELVAWLDKRSAKAEGPSATLALMCKSRRLAELGRAEEALTSCQDSVERFDVCANQFEPEIRQWIGWHMEGTRALALMAKGASQMAINSFRSAYGAFDHVNDLHLVEMLRLVPELIAAGASERELVDVLRSDTGRAQRLLPIIVALQQRMSESVRASAEILEVAGDYEKLVSKRMVEGVRPGFVLQVENLLG